MLWFWLLPAVAGAPVNPPADSRAGDVTAGAAGRAGPGLGRQLDHGQVASITVFQDGRGLPAGQGTVQQGLLVYRQHCMACHGEHGRDGLNDQLAGGQRYGQRTIGSYWPYAPTLFDYIRRAMPYQNAGLLSDADTYAVVAYLLFLNGLWSEQDVLDAAALTKIVMPNRKNFTSEYELP